MRSVAHDVAGKIIGTIRGCFSPGTALRDNPGENDDSNIARQEVTDRHSLDSGRRAGCQDMQDRCRL